MAFKTTHTSVSRSGIITKSNKNVKNEKQNEEKEMGKEKRKKK